MLGGVDRRRRLTPEMVCLLVINEMGGVQYVIGGEDVVGMDCDQ